MIETLPTRENLFTVDAQSRRSTLYWLLWYGFLVATSLYVAREILSDGPHMATFIWVLFFLGAAAIIYQPRYGVYLTLLLALPGDALLLHWYPFVKNLSSSESILFLNKSIAVSPAEIYITLTFVSWLGLGLMRRELRFYRGPLFWPALAFLSFVVFGLLYGLRMRGDLVIALWQVRPMFYMVAMLVLASNLLKTRLQVNRLMWMAIIALIFESFAGLYYVASDLQFNIGSVNRIAEHSSSIHANSIFIFLLAVWIYRGSHRKRLTLLLVLPIVLTSYLANQRRAAFLSLALVLVIVAFVLYREQRLAFWLSVPLCSLLCVVYLAIFWNASGVIALPANAVKSVVASEQSAEQSSNEYRDIENHNLHFTIRQRPLTGIGFGNRFYVQVPLPDISWFAWWNYFPHNSILWIWVNMGLGGFLAMLLLIGSTIMTGARALRRLPPDGMSAIALTALLYIAAHFVFTYVDIAWDAQSMIYVGSMMAVLNSIEHIVQQPQSLPEKRWPWQPDPVPLPGLREAVR